MNPYYDLDHPFVVTQAYLDIREEVARARDNRDTVSIIGASGTGKSTALRKLAADNGFFYTEVNDGITKPAACCQRILLDAGIDPPKYVREQEIEIFRLLQSRGWDEDRAPAKVLIIDEVQELLPQTIRLLMAAREKAKAGLVLAGNEKSLVRSRGVAEAHYKAVNNRILSRLTLKHCTAKDCRDIAETFGVEEMDAYRACENFGTQRDFHKLRRLLTTARELTDSKTLRLQHIENAAIVMPGDNRKALSPVVVPFPQERS
tara:strand:+ start:40985 stop:41767 length:783 start_codon:yes stop_codon:yes gene_type:complete